MAETAELKVELSAETVDALNRLVKAGLGATSNEVAEYLIKRSLEDMVIGRNDPLRLFDPERVGR